jgi:hypothetical protein
MYTFLLLMDLLLNYDNKEQRRENDVAERLFTTLFTPYSNPASVTHLLSLFLIRYFIFLHPLHLINSIVDCKD